MRDQNTTRSDDNKLSFIRKLYHFLCPEGTLRRQRIHAFFQKREAKKHEPWRVHSDKEMHDLIKTRKRAFSHGKFADAESKRLFALKNRHANETCFIVCTGPSLLLSDLEKLKDKVCFGVNSILDCYSKTTWRPTYYCVVDYYAFDVALRQKDVCEGRYATNECFFHYRLKPKFSSKEDFFLPVSYKNHEPSYLKRNKILLSDELSVCVYDAFTVATMAIQIAVYMGFKKIYLLGVDNSYTKDNRHFEESSMNDVQLCIEDFSIVEERARNGFAACKAFCESKGVEIYNATRGGKLEVFRRVNLDQVLLDEGIK